MCLGCNVYSMPDCSATAQPIFALLLGQLCTFLKLFFALLLRDWWALKMFSALMSKLVRAAPAHKR